MKTFTMNLSDEEHKMLKTFCSFQGINIKDYLLDLFKQDYTNSKGINFDDLNKETQDCITETRKNKDTLKKYNSSKELFQELGI